MEDNSKYSNVYVCGITVSELNAAFDKYRKDSADGVVALPSLPHFLSCLPEYIGEDDLQAYLRDNADKRGTYTIGTKCIKRILQWFRGQYLSNPAWSGHQAQKAILALGADFGDGVKLRKDDAKSRQNGPSELRVRFGDDDMSRSAGK